MPRYFIHFRIRGTRETDQEGVLLRAIDIPPTEWTRLIRAVFAGDCERELRGGQFEITDENHQIVAIVPMGGRRTDESAD